MLLFHRTSVSEARAIVRDGFRDEKWSFGTDAVTGEAVKAVGVWLTDRVLPAEEGPQGAATLEITLTLPEAALSPFEVSGVIEDAQLWIIPARVVNQHAGISISGVDPRSSWFHERVEDIEE
ncbi:MAG: hypothetical protein HY700_10010 [Gemmatimonadetes bacterium]|nr:hypothetical protein [Gemmatimonadota bacterium]